MVLDVGDDKREDHAFFAAIAKQMKAGGHQAMMYDLLHRDVSKEPNPKRIIPTPALFRQILRSIGSEGRYMHQMLDEGRLPQSGFNPPDVTTIKALLEDLNATQPQGRRSTRESLGRYINRTFGGLVTTRPNGMYVATGRGAGLERERSTEYAFAPLADCRKRFEHLAGQKVEWSDTTDEWLGPEAGEDTPF